MSIWNKIKNLFDSPKIRSIRLKALDNNQKLIHDKDEDKMMV